MVRFEMTPWLADMLGAAAIDVDVDVDGGITVNEALAALIARLPRDRSGHIMREGRLHPSVLVVVDGVVCHDRDVPVNGTTTIRLMLPVAGG